MSCIKSAFWVILVTLFGIAGAAASPLAQPGDSALRHDVELLADAGIITGPVSTWPLAWPQVAADLSKVPEDAHYPPAVAGALKRMRSRLQLVMHDGVRTGVHARGGTDPQFLRSFDDTPRAQAEAGAYVDWTSGHFAGRLDLQYADDPADDREARLDGSWIGAVFGNWMLAGGYLNRYWGPAWQGGLIISNNPRPPAGITLRRVRSTPFQSKWLSWIGPWNFTIFADRLSSERAFPNTILLGYRLAIKPLPSLEIGFSRTSQFGGGDRHVGVDSVINALAGKTTSTGALVGSAQAENSLGGGDIRWRLPFINSAVYGEFIGEDEKGSRPDLVMAQGGIEFWGGIGDNGASWRLVYERTDTKAYFFRSSEQTSSSAYGIAYNNSDFPTGYRYRGRAIGYPADGDALLSSVRAMLVTPRGQEYRLVATTGSVNRAANHKPGLATRNSLTPRYEHVDALDLGWSGQFYWGKLDLGLGVTYRDYDGGSLTKGHGWVGISREFD